MKYTICVRVGRFWKKIVGLSQGKAYRMALTYEQQGIYFRLMKEVGK